jgi:hypothetical protein
LTGRQTLAAGCVIALATLAAACGKDSASGNPNSPSSVTPTLTAPKAESPVDAAQLDTLRPTLTVTNATSTVSGGARTYEFQISDTSDFAASSAAFISSYRVIDSKTGVPEGAGRTSYTPATDLQPTTLFYWRARVAQGSAVSPWSDVQKFRTKLVGYLRAGELYDPLIHGETVGERVGATEFVAGRGIRLITNLSYVKYLLPQTISNGEFSMDVEGLAPDVPGDKSKVFGMQEGQGDFITNLWRVDAQYRGAQGVPPNCIQWRAMFGDDSHKIEPPTDYRFQSVYRLDPNKAYHWRGRWSNGFTLDVFEGPPTGTPLYSRYEETSATYRPNPHYAYLGTPVGRSGAESATIPGTIYRNVWLGNRPRPSTLGSAIDVRW